MSALLERTLARRGWMIDTTRATMQAAYDLARTLPDGMEAARFTSLARRVDTCLSSTVVKVVKPDDDAPWVSMTCKRQCHTRFCIPCEWRRCGTLRRLANSLLDTIWQNHPAMRGSLLGLSSRNRPVAQASAMLADHIGAMKRFFDLDEVKRAHFGALSAIELPVRGSNAAPEIGVHSHHLLLVDDSRFRPDTYLDIERIRDLWAASLSVDYRPMCDVRVVQAEPGEDQRDALRKALVETQKYVLKPSSLLSTKSPEDFFDLMDTGRLFVNPTVLLHLHRALFRRRLITMNGLWMTAQKAQRTASKKTDPSEWNAKASDEIPF